MRKCDVEKDLQEIIKRDGGAYVTLNVGFEMYVTDENKIIFEDENMIIISNGFSVKADYREIRAVF